LIRSFEDKTPIIGEGSYIDETAVVIGDVIIGKNCSVWPMTVIRGDVNIIRIGDNTNIQDGSVLHVSHQGEFNARGAELHIGNQVTVGHKVLLHGCRIGDRCLIGMGSIVADNAVLENEVMLGSGSLVPPGKILESGYLYLGSPVQQKRRLSGREIESLRYLSDHYVQTKNRYGE
jgi:carbonic anhydrase/acetyltransferase-like protein (isoleucine patch superfamily)